MRHLLNTRRFFISGTNFVVVVLVLLTTSVAMLWNTRTSLAATTHLPPECQQISGIFLLSPAILHYTKRALDRDPILRASLHQLTTQANALLTITPPSVTQKTQLPPGGDIHDYYSLAPYWWPNPNTPDHLPYVQRDGQTNPEIYTIPDKVGIYTMADDVYTLALAYYFTDKESYAAKATSFLHVWFLNKATAMNPNLNHAQVIKGINTGGSPGIIEARYFSHVIDAIGFLARSDSWKDHDEQGMKKWFSQYLTWLETSPLGQQEGSAINNHSTWYDVQTASIALFLHQTSAAKKILQASFARHIDGHILADGSQPFEITRTLSWHYSVFNLQALFWLASMGDRVGVDLWHYTNPQGAGLQKALDYVLPAALGAPWPYQQITPLLPSELVEVLYQAAAHYHKASYLQAAKSIIGADANKNLDNLLYGDTTGKHDEDVTKE
ncbi:MAG: alginate lyase family protein [Ktedonobacteraceae bacterium]|nr:alginate lyase family protein [Ktedonobacteraceae bacterium]